jgi:hypothetical protein
MQRQVFSIGNETILCQLPGRVVEDGNACSGRREHQTLLAATRRETWQVQVKAAWKPMSMLRRQLPLV